MLAVSAAEERTGKGVPMSGKCTDGACPNASGYDRWAYEKAIRAGELSMAAKCAGYALASRAKRTTGRWALSADTLAKETGASKRTVFRALRELEDASLLRRIRRASKLGRAANEYQLTLPPKCQGGILGSCHLGTLERVNGSPKCHPGTAAKCQPGTQYQPTNPLDSRERGVGGRPCLGCGYRLPAETDLCPSCGFENLK